MFVTNVLFAILIFLLGVVVGLFVPLFCVKLYEAVGCSIGDICEDGEVQDAV